jgi:alkaline phosphatase
MKVSYICLSFLWVSALAFSAAAGPDPSFVQGRGELRSRLSIEPDQREARNLVLMIGDGNGVNSVTATRIFAGQEQGLDGEEFQLAYEKMPYLALLKTYNTDAQVPDSAGTITALLTGQKTRAGVLGVDSDLARGDCANVPNHRLPSLFDIAREKGWARGIVTTTRLTHATPAGAFAASADRDYESDARMPADCLAQKDIAAQLPEAEMDFVAGGGSSQFLGAADASLPGLRGERKDGRNLMIEARQNGIDVPLTASEFRNLPLDGQKPVLGLLASSHMSFEADRKGQEEPSLAEMTTAAIRHLKATGKRWVLLVEAGRIDHGHHATNPRRALKDGVAFADAVTAAQENAGTDTLIIVTADHSHTLTIQGYPRRGSPITGLCEKIGGKQGAPCRDAKGTPYPTLSYANGLRTPPSGGRTAPDPEKIRSDDFLVETLIPQPFETHGGADVAAYAQGPGAWLVSGTMEQNTLFHVMGHATGLVPSNTPAPPRGAADAVKP